MKISVVAVGLKMPKWADEACEDYLHRFPSDWKLELKTVKAEDRNTRTIPKVMQAEAERIRAALPKGLKAEADFTLRLSSLTLPHAMARVLLLEQIYRSWSLLHNHPYHRA